MYRSYRKQRGAYGAVLEACTCVDGGKKKSIQAISGDWQTEEGRAWIIHDPSVTDASIPPLIITQKPPTLGP